MNIIDVMQKLQAPFPPEEIEWRVGSTNHDKTKGLALAYVTNRAIQNRLDEVFGPFGWQNGFKEWKSNSQICGISVWDDDKKQWITKWDGADDSQTEAVKGGLSDSMKRAAYQWGIGRYLYKLPQTWVKIKAVGNPNKPTYVLDEIPKLPAWALPKPDKQESETISEVQAKRLFAIAGKGNEKLVKDVLLKHKYINSTDIKKSEYELIVQELTNLKGAGA